MAKSSAADIFQLSKKRASGGGEPANPSPNSETSRLGDQPSSSSMAAPTAQTETPKLTYRKTSVHLTPELYEWLKQATKQFTEPGLSASDVVRLALDRLRNDVTLRGLDLEDEAVKQAHREAERMPGRRNRGLPSID